MKIGIVTFWQSDDNYGQLLQCWALQQYLRNLGHDPFLIRYVYKPSIWDKWSSRIFKSMLIFPLLKYCILKNERKENLRLIAENRIKNKVRFFDGFRKSYLCSSSCLYGKITELRHTPPCADAYIVGSDQVWSPVFMNKKEMGVYWLDFGDVSTRRIAYAVSFGTDHCSRRQLGLLKRHLKRFNYISVREASGVDICRILGREAEHVLDPTLLLSQEDYMIFTLNTSVKKSPYIYIYSINIQGKEEIAWSVLREFACKKRWSIKVTPSSGYIQGRELFDDVEYIYATIPEWISQIKNSELVVTTSFHGIVFCLLFHKHFVYFPLEGIYEKGNNRVMDLLRILNLSNCIWGVSNSFEAIYNFLIDWDNIDVKLLYLRRKSTSFLNRALT